MLVELDSLNWLYKDLYSGKEDSNLEIKSSMLSVCPKVNAIKYVNSIKITFLLYLNIITICYYYVKKVHGNPGFSWFSFASSQILYK